MKPLLRTLSLLALVGAMLTSCGGSVEEDPTPAKNEHAVKFVAEADQPFSTPASTPTLNTVSYIFPAQAAVAVVTAAGTLRWEKEFTDVKDISLLTLSAESMSATRITLSIYVDGDFKGQKVNSAPTSGRDQQYRTATLQWSEKLGVMP